MPSAENSASPKLNIVVVGAGIAGLAAAAALRHHNVTVIEQSRLKEEVGAAIHLGPNASKIAIEWGLNLETLNSPEVAWYHEMAADGKTHMKIPIFARKYFGAPWLLNHRVDLHQELRRLATSPELAGQPATLRTGVKVKSIDCDGGVIELVDGETITADLIVGADGIHSVTRTAVLGRELVAQPSGFSAYRCLIPREKVIHNPNLLYLLDGDDTGKGFSTFMGQDRRLVAYPARGSTLLNVVAIVPDETLDREATEQWHEAGSLDKLLESFKDFGEDAKDILRAANGCVLWQLRDQEPLETWTKGRTIIIGDASHAMLPHQGQGGGQAIEDAEALGALLVPGTTAADVPARLQAVQRVRYERASTIQGYSREKALGPKEGAAILNAQEYAMFNFGYSGAVAWAAKNGIETDVEVAA